MTPDVNVLVAAFRADHLQHAAALPLDKRLAGNELPDAWIAAAVQLQGDRLCTFDRDFRRLLPAGDLLLLEAGTAS